MRKNGFTLAEVLITLAVIGVVAAVMLPTLINKINDAQYDRARQKILSSIGETWKIIAVQGEMTQASNAEDFVNSYLSKRLKIIKTCDSLNLDKCGLSKKIKNLSNTVVDMPVSIATLNSIYNVGNTKSHKDKPSYGFVMANGYSVNIFYNPDCIPDTNNGNTNAPDYICINAIYDMNGLKNPNKFGKDIGIITSLYPNETSRVVAPNPAPESAGNPLNPNIFGQICTNQNKDYYPPDKDELLALIYNNKITAFTGSYYWSGSKHSSKNCWWGNNFPLSRRACQASGNGFILHCIKR